MKAAIRSGESSRISGLTSIDRRLFVLFFSNSAGQITVYEESATVDNNTEFTVQSYIKVADLGRSTHNGIQSCATNQCLYVSDHDNNIVYRVKLSDNNEVLKWPVADSPRGLSVSIDHNLLVACRGGFIREYTTHGHLVRAINLESLGIRFPWHAVQLSNRHFAVSHGKPLENVVLLNEEGILRGRYTDKLQKVLKWKPFDLAVGTKNEGILVVDQRNHKIIFVNSSLTDSCPIVVLRKEPWTLHIDEERNRLYVGETYNRILVFDFNFRRFLYEMKSFWC